MSPGTMRQSDFLARARAAIRRRTGLVFSEARRSELERGLLAAMQRTGATDPDAYLLRLEAEARALDDLVAEITVGETYFFREAEQFAVIREQILPDVTERLGEARPVRIWSAGCATGEEPYSIALLLREAGHDGAARILGTDISRAALERARRGRYARWSFRGVSENLIQAHFIAKGHEFSLGPAIRGAVDFGYLNLAEDSYPSLATGVWGMDLILCRNVLIYFDSETVARVAQRLLDSLAEGGWLLLGASDPMLGDLVPCEVVVTRAGLAYRRAEEHRRTRASAHERGRTRRSTDERERAQPSVSHGPMADRVPTWEAGSSPAVRRPEEVAVAKPTSPGPSEDAERAAVALVRTLANRGALVEAGRACATAMDRHRTSAELAYLHAVLLAEGGRPADSAVAARTALYLDHNLAMGHLALGTVLSRLNDGAGARRSFRNAGRLLAAMPPEAPVPASDGEPAARLAEMVRLRLRLLGEGEGW